MSGRKLGVTADHRRAMLRSLTQALILHEKITTTETRAKELRSVAEKLITWTKQDTVHARRQARRLLNDETLVKRLFDTVGPKFRNVNGGYTRIVKIGLRRGDAALMARIELTSE
ncbi:MAG: 50S ribosomal protein L17 [Armatimonadetes bacterium]|nr:50S ribosomal protein L17 [Armatimonadota bacterium]